MTWTSTRLAEIQRAVGEAHGMNVRLNGTPRPAGEVSGLLDTMRLAVLRSVKDVQAQLEVVEALVGADAPALSIRPLGDNQPLQLEK